MIGILTSRPTFSDGKKNISPGVISKGEVEEHLIQISPEIRLVTPLPI